MGDTDYMLTTYDNPFNPFKDFTRWFKEDMRLGHNTCGVLAKEANISPIFSDELNEAETERAMNEITNNFPMIWKIVYPKDYK